MVEAPLRPLVVVGVAGGDFTIPVVGQAQLLQLRLHLGNVLVRPGGGVNAPVDGGIFGRQAKGVPAHGVEHTVALHSLEAGDDISNCIIAHMPHMQVARGVGKH